MYMGAALQVGRGGGRGIGSGAGWGKRHRQLGGEAGLN